MAILSCFRDIDGEGKLERMMSTEVGRTVAKTPRMGLVQGLITVDQE